MVVSLRNSQGQIYGVVRNGLNIIAPAYDITKGSSLCLEFEHISGDCTAQNRQCDEVSAELPQRM